MATLQQTVLQHRLHKQLGNATGVSNGSIMNNSSFNFPTDIHRPMPDRDKSILPSQFTTPRRVGSRLNKSTASGIGQNNTTFLCNNLIDECEVNLDPFLKPVESASANSLSTITQETIFEAPLNKLKDILTSYLPFRLGAIDERELTSEDKFPTQRLVRCVQWHPQCLRVDSFDTPSEPEHYNAYLPGYSKNKWAGKPRVALVYSSNIVEVHHTGDYVLNNDDGARPPAITLRHRLHEDLTSCAWRPNCFSTLAVCSTKNGVIFWHKLGRRDVRSVATITSVYDRTKLEKTVPGCHAQHIWQPPDWFKRPTEAHRRSVEQACSLAWTSNGDTLGILWYGTVFLVKPCNFSELGHGFQAVPIGKIEALTTPFAWNFSENTSLFYASSLQGQSVIFDVKQRFKAISNWNEGKVISRYSVKSSERVENGTWWDCTDSNTKPDTVEGIFLHYYKRDTKLLVIQINKSSVEANSAWHDECKQVFDLNHLVVGDMGYFDAADPDDTLRNLKAELEITAIAWKDDICCVGHGPGKLTVLKARVNIGGIAFQYLRTLEAESASPIIDITIFQNRQVAITQEDGVFEYCTIEKF